MVYPIGGGNECISDLKKMDGNNELFSHPNFSLWYSTGNARLLYFFVFYLGGFRESRFDGD